MSARDWQLLVDLEHQLKFPSHIAVTTLRPDIVLVSESTKQAVLLELTVPWEDRLEEAFEAFQVRRTGQRLSAGWLESKVFPCGGWMPRICSPFLGQSLQ